MTTLILSPGQSFRDIDIGPEMIVAPAGEFMFDALQTGWDVVVHSSRARYWGGRKAMRNYVRAHAGNLWDDGCGHGGL